MGCASPEIMIFELKAKTIATRWKKAASFKTPFAI
jgi:hypothetical protein